MELRDALQHLALEMPSYGWRRITAELRRRGRRVNHKRVRRLMREDNLLCLRRRKFVLTTDSDHRLAPGAGARAHRSRPTLGGRFDLHPPGTGVRVLGGDPGCL